MTEERAKTIKVHYSPTTGTGYTLIPMNDERISRPRDGKTILTTPENESEPQINILLRSDEPKDRSHKHVKKKHKHNRGPRETRLDTKTKIGGKRMQPMTSRRITKQALRCCVTKLNPNTLRKLLLIEYPDKLYGYTSIVTDPCEDLLGLELPTTKLPMQYGSKKKRTQHIINQDLLSARSEKELTRDIYNQGEPLSLLDCYELDSENLNNMYVASGVPAENLQQTWNRTQRQTQKQRFDEYIRSLYYTEAQEQATQQNLDEYARACVRSGTAIFIIRQH